MQSILLGGEDNYWLKHALRYCKEEHLSKAYAKPGNALIDIDIAVARPNYGLAHTARVMQYIKPVIEYFALFAIDPGFKAFCQTLGDSDLTLLKVAAAFNATGRDDEAILSVNPYGYMNDRESAVSNFEAYLKKFPRLMKELTTAGKDEIAKKSSIIEALRYVDNSIHKLTFNTAAHREERPTWGAPKIRELLSGVIQTFAHLVNVIGVRLKSLT